MERLAGVARTRHFRRRPRNDNACARKRATIASLWYTVGMRVLLDGAVGREAFDVEQTRGARGRHRHGSLGGSSGSGARGVDRHRLGGGRSRQRRRRGSLTAYDGGGGGGNAESDKFRWSKLFPAGAG